ncbi:uncharacterized protein C7orf57 homolog [Ciona intestinalis]
MAAESGDYMKPTSQIPGLSDIMPEDESEKRKNFIKPTDSDYVKLSKQGGAKDLLTINSNVKNDAPVDYPKSDWFGHHGMDDQEQQKTLAERHWKAPDYMVYSEDAKPSSGNRGSVVETEKPRALTAHEEMLLIQAKYKGTSVPYQTDNLSYWERKEDPPLRSRRHK